MKTRLILTTVIVLGLSPLVFAQGGPGYGQGPGWRDATERTENLRGAYGAQDSTAPWPGRWWAADDRGPQDRGARFADCPRRFGRHGYQGWHKYRRCLGRKANQPWWDGQSRGRGFRPGAHRPRGGGRGWQARGLGYGPPGYGKPAGQGGGWYGWESSRQEPVGICLLLPPAADTDPLDDDAKQALRQALLNEWANEAYLGKMTETFGTIRLLQRRIAAKQRHAGVLLELFKRYNVKPPARDEVVVPQVPASQQQAIQAAIDAEQASINMYDELLKFVTQEDIKQVFSRLRDVSSSRHLPAWKRAM